MTATVPDVRRIVVLRANALGDYLLAEPALRALYTHYPDARITLVGSPWQRGLLTTRPGPVDEVRVLPRVPGLGGQPADAPPTRELPAFLRLIRATRPDLALQLHGGGAASNPLTSAFGARISAGPQAPGAPPLNRTIPYRYYQHETARYLEVVALVGARPAPEGLDGGRPRFELTEADHTEADAALSPAGLAADDGTPLVALHPGVSDPRRRWPSTSFAAVADELHAHGARVLLTGAPADAELTAAIAEAAHAPVLDLTAHTSLGGLAAVYRRCAMVVGVDTGPLHLARAVATPTVTIFWCGNALNAAPAERHADRVVIGWTLRCPDCGASCHNDLYPLRDLGVGCPHHSSWVADVPPGEVVEEAIDLLDRDPPRR